MINQAIILAGGMGTRLGEITKETPKPMVLVDKKPFLDYLVFNLKRYGFQNIIFSTGYLTEKISNYFGDGSSYGLNFEYIVETEPLGTGGAIKLSSSFLDNEFLVLNGDSLFDFDFRELGKLLLNTPSAMIAMALKFKKDTKRYGQVVLNEQYIRGYIEKGVSSESGLINSGVYLMRHEAIDSLPEGFCSLENDLFPSLVNRSLIVGYEFNGYFIDIGLPHELKRAQTELSAWADSNNLF